MKFLLNQGFKVLRKGSHVKANEEAGEMIFDTSDDKNFSGFTMGMMEEITLSNKLRNVGGKDKTKYLNTLKEALETMENVAEQNQPTETEIASDIIRDGFEDGVSDDDIMIQLVQAGIAFRKVQKVFKDVTESLGLRVSISDVKETAANLLAELDFNPETYDEVQDMLTKIREASGCDEKQALTAVRSFAKDNEIALPKKTSGRRGAIGFKSEMYAWMVSNPHAAEDEMKKFLESKGKDPEKTSKKFMEIFELCKEFASKNAELFVE